MYSYKGILAEAPNKINLFYKSVKKEKKEQKEHRNRMNEFQKLFFLTTDIIFAIIRLAVADVAHLVERHLAKVEVASSSLVIRSRMLVGRQAFFFFTDISCLNSQVCHDRIMEVR